MTHPNDLPENLTKVERAQLEADMWPRPQESDRRRTGWNDAITAALQVLDQFAATDLLKDHVRNLRR